MQSIPFHNLTKCKWDKEKKVLTTSEDEKSVKEAVMDNAAWYKIFFEPLLTTHRKRRKGDRIMSTPNIYTTWMVLTPSSPLESA